MPVTLCPSRCHGDSYHHCQRHRQDQSDSEAPSRRRVAVRPGLVAWHGSGLAGQRKVPLPRAPCRLAAISRLTEREQGAGGACFSDPGPAGHFPSPSKSVEAVREQTDHTHFRAGSRDTEPATGPWTKGPRLKRRGSCRGSAPSCRHVLGGQDCVGGGPRVSGPRSTVGLGSSGALSSVSGRNLYLRSRSKIHQYFRLKLH